MSTDETFGDVEEFGDPLETAPAVESGPVDPLLQVIQEAEAALAEAIAMEDEVAQARQRKILETAHAQLATDTNGNTEEQKKVEQIEDTAHFDLKDMVWLKQTCQNIWGVDAGGNWFDQAVNSGCDFDRIWEQVKPLYRAPESTSDTQPEETPKEQKEKKPRKARNKAEQATTEPLTVEQVSAAYNDIVKEGALAGVLDPQIVWDEMGLDDLTEPNLIVFEAEMLKRIATAKGEAFNETEQLAAEQSATYLEQAIGQEKEKPDWLKEKLAAAAAETTLPGLLKYLGWQEIPRELTTEQTEQIIDIISTRRRRAQTLENNAKAMIKPLRESANFFEETFGLQIDKYFEKHQSRKQDGSYRTKTMQLRTGTLSYRGTTGGYSIAAEGEFHEWLKTADETTRKKYNIELAFNFSADEVEALKLQDAVKDKKVDYKYDCEKLLKGVNAGTLPPVAGMVKLTANELKTRTIE